MAMTAAPLSAVLRLGLTLRIQGPSVDGSFLPHGQPPGRPSAPGSQEPLCVAHRRQEVSSWGDRRTSTTCEENSKNQTVFFPSTKIVPAAINLAVLAYSSTKCPRLAIFWLGLTTVGLETKSLSFCSSNLWGRQPGGEHRPSSQGGHGGSNKPSGRGTLRGSSTLCPGDLARALAFTTKQAEGAALNRPRWWDPVFTNVK